MIELAAETVTIVMLGGVLLGVFIGYPVAISIGAVAAAMGLILFGVPVFDLMYQRLFDILVNYIMLAIPLFILMGCFLQYSGLAERLYAALYVCFGSLRGGLAIITVLVGAIVAACVGVVGASISLLALLSLPAMIRRGYNKTLASGSICAAGTLGTLIPPSVPIIIYGPMAQVSVGKLLMGAFFPGFSLAGIYILYILIRCLVQPRLAPAMPFEERTRISLGRKITMLTSSLVPIVILVITVLGSIFMGLAPPTQAASIGAFGAVLLTVAYRKFSLEVLKRVITTTMLMTSMIMLIAAMSVAFTAVFLRAGCDDVVKGFILAAPGGPWGSFAIIQIIIFVMGFFIEILGIIFIMVPIIAPLVPILGFDPVWFGIIVMLNFQTAYMTPPMAVSIYYLRGAAPPDLGVKTAEIVRGIAPFVLLVLVMLVLCIVFPELVLWLPGKMIK